MDEKVKVLVIDRVRYLMNTEKLSQYALAKAIKVSESTVCNWLNGKKEPSIESLWKLADYFDVSVDYIIGRKEFI